MVDALPWQYGSSVILGITNTADDLDIDDDRHGRVLPPGAGTLEEWVAYIFMALEENWSLYGGWSPCRSLEVLWPTGKHCYYKAELSTQEFDIQVVKSLPWHHSFAVADEVAKFRTMSEKHVLFINACLSRFRLEFPVDTFTEECTRRRLEFVDFIQVVKSLPWHHSFAVADEVAKFRTMSEKHVLFINACLSRFRLEFPVDTFTEECTRRRLEFVDFIQDECIEHVSGALTLLEMCRCAPRRDNGLIQLALGDLLVGQRALAAQSPPGVKKLKLGEDSEEIKNVSTDGSKESDAYNKGIIRKAAAWRKKFNPKGHTELLPPHLLGFHQLNRDGIACNGDRCDTLMQSFLSDGFDEDEAERDNFAVRVTGPDDP